MSIAELRILLDLHPESKTSILWKYAKPTKSKGFNSRHVFIDSEDGQYIGVKAMEDYP